jgi:hypothetical protein
MDPSAQHHGLPVTPLKLSTSNNPMAL